jgi:3-hydroxyacyl-CoA dehydrogenase
MDIKKVACVGVGLVGHSWATLFSSNGVEVVLYDTAKDFPIAALERIRSNLDFLEKNTLLHKGGSEAALKRVRTVTKLAEAVEDVDYIQESVPDDYELKGRVFKAMDAAASEHTILASSSSGLLMTNIQKVTKKPNRCVMAHPYLPPHLMPLVEIVGGKKTSEETVKTTYDFMLKMNRVPVVVKKETAGYIVNRLKAALWRETVDLVDSGVASAEDVDRAFCAGLGIRYALMGPSLGAHVAAGGIEQFIENYDQSYTSRWETMKTWTSMPYSGARNMIRSVKEMRVNNVKKLEEIIKWRDEKLVKLLRLLSEDRPDGKYGLMPYDSVATHLETSKRNDKKDERRVGSERGSKKE